MPNQSALLAFCCATATFQPLHAQDLPPVPGTSPPKQLRETCTFADYPAGAARRNEQGTTKIRITVNAQGKLTKYEILSSSGSIDLDQATATFLGSCSYQPGTKEGKAVESQIEMRFVWKLA